MGVLTLQSENTRENKPQGEKKKKQQETEQDRFGSTQQ